jgi:hypothetical protein
VTLKTAKSLSLGVPLIMDEVIEQTVRNAIICGGKPLWVLAVSKCCVAVLAGGNGRSFFGFDYARIAARSGWTPMMFMIRVRL